MAGGGVVLIGTQPVSCTHLDVYKRQQAGHAGTIEKTAGTGEAGNPLVY